MNNIIIQKLKKRHLLMKGILGGLLFAALLWISFQERSTWILWLNHPGNFEALLKNYGPFSIYVYIILQAVLMAFAPIPSEALLFTGGYLYGAFLGALCSFVAIFLGTLIALGLAHYFGLPLLKYFLSLKYWEKWLDVKEKRRIDWVLFLLFLIPGFPKDALTYIVGLTTNNVGKSLLLILIARTPSIIILSYIGANLQGPNGRQLLIGVTIAAVFLLGGFLVKNKMLAKPRASKSGYFQT